MVSSVDIKNQFSFEPFTANDTSQQIKHLDFNKATQESDIPTKLVIRFYNLMVDYQQEHFNNCPKKGTFPNNFKKAVVHQPKKRTAKRKN